MSSGVSAGRVGIQYGYGLAEGRVRVRARYLVGSVTEPKCR